MFSLVTAEEGRAKNLPILPAISKDMKKPSKAQYKLSKSPDTYWHRL